MRRFLAGALLIVCTSCERSSVARAEVEPAVLARVGYVDGCDALFEDHRCLVQTPRQVRLWIDEVERDRTIELWHESKLLDRRASSGLLTGMPVVNAGTMVVRVDGERVFSLELAPMPQDYREVLDRFWATFDAAGLSIAREQLERERARARGVTRQLLNCHAGLVAYEDKDGAAVLEHASEGEVDLSCAADLHIQAARIALADYDFERARAHLTAAKAHPWLLTKQLDASSEEWHLERRFGRLDASVRGLAEVATRARELRVHDTAAQADIMAAVALAMLGRFEQALQLSRRALADPEIDEELRRQLRQNAVWIQVDWRKEQPDVADPSSDLLALIDEFEAGRTPEDMDRATSTRLILATAAAQDHDYRRVRSELERVDPARLNLSELVQVELLFAEIAEQERRFERAREHIERAESYASLGFEFDSQLLVALALGNLERQAGDREAARRAYERAEQLADRLVLSISPSAGRSLFGVKLRAAQATQIELLLELDDESAALCTILGARARHLRSLAARRDRLDSADAERLARLLGEHERVREQLELENANEWKRSAAEKLALPARVAELHARLDALNGEAVTLLEGAPIRWSCENVRDVSHPDRALLTMHPASGAGWWFVLARGEQLRWVKSEVDEPAAAAADALDRLEIAAALEGATELEIIPVGEMIAVDYHMLAPLLATRVPIVYGLGLGHPDTESEARAAVVHRGRSKLLGPDLEVAEVAARLRSVGWAVASDWDPRAEHQPTLLHFAGHGYFAGVAGWESKLELADRTLTGAELLVLQRAPELVVLGACEAGTNDSRVIDGGMNMASAFLLAGSELVIAPDERVADEVAVSFATVLYQTPPEPGSTRASALVEALARIQRTDARFGSWRAWVR